MKRIILMIMLLVAVTGSTLLAAGDDGVTPHAKRTFEKEFPQALYAKWEKLANTDVYLVRFVYKEQALVSYIDGDGTVLATARNIERHSIPFMVNETMAKRFDDFKIIQIEELTTAADVSYFFTLENDKAKIYLRVFNNGSYSEIKKEKKKFNVVLAKQ